MVSKPIGGALSDQFSHLEVIFLLNKFPAESVEKGARQGARM